jgi:hypothetical protein
MLIDASTTLLTMAIFILIGHRVHILYRALFFEASFCFNLSHINGFGSAVTLLLRSSLQLH